MIDAFVKHWRLVSLGLGIIVFLWVLYLLRIFIFPFAIGLVLAYLLMPLVYWLEEHLPPRGKWPSFKRVFSVLLAFVLLICIIGGLAYFIVTAVIDASIILLESVPYFFGKSLLELQVWFEGIIESLPLDIQQEVKRELIEGGVSVGQYIRGALMGAVSSISGTFSMIIGFVVLPFFLFYIMKDSEKLKKGFAAALPPAVAEHGRNVVLIVERVLGRYIRAQIMLGVIVAYFSFVGLLLLKVPFSLALALLAGVTEVIPTLGPWIGGGVAVIVTLAMAPEKTIWVAALFVGIQLVENSLLVPKIQSAYLRIHPAIMIFLLVFGAYIAGFWGLLIIGPLVATLVEIYDYIRDYYQSQQQAEEAGAGQSA
ncbi:AI-2E family transporter [Chloroflexota bacterium]